MSERSSKVRQLQCLACTLWSQKYGVSITTGQQTDEHHLNLGGHAGQRRIGRDHSIPLCQWHHQGEAPYQLSATVAAAVYGPSLARQSKAFREIFGTDEALLTMTNELLETV